MKHTLFLHNINFFLKKALIILVSLLGDGVTESEGTRAGSEVPSRQQTGKY